MGYASPSIGYTGYVASDDILTSDDTEQTNSTTDYVVVYTGRFLNDLRAGSTLRFTAETYVDVGATSMTTVLSCNGTNLMVLQQTAHAYGGQTKDFDIPEGCGGKEFEISIKTSSAPHTAHIKLVKIRGKPSPIILD